MAQWLVTYDEDLANRIREVVGREPGLSERKMFGGLAFLVNGNMSVAASREGGLLLRVDPARTEELLARKHARSFVMRGKPMDGWIRVDPEGLRNKRDLERWVGVGTDFARTLPKKTRSKGAGRRDRLRRG